MNAPIHPSIWSNRKQRDYAEKVGREAWATLDLELALRIRCACSAVEEGSPLLDAAAILHPPHAWFDAALARQMMVYVLVYEMRVPRRKVSAVSLMSRETIARGLRTIKARLGNPKFDDALSRMQLRASQLYQEARATTHG